MTVSSAAPLGSVLRYGALGLPLAFVALPMAVQWPAYAAAQWALPLGTLGLLLLVVRLGDAVVDPWIGGLADRWFAASARRPWWGLAVAAGLLVAGFAGLFFAPFPAEAPRSALLAWLAAALVLTYLGYSVAQVVHQAWAARLGGDAVARSRWVGAREGFALAGVMLASVLPTLAGWTVTLGVLAAALVIGLALLRGVPTGSATLGSGPGRRPPVEAESSPWRSIGFRSLLAVYAANGLAASIPASLVLFMIRDRVQAPPAMEALFLAAYFGAAALAVPLWVRAVDAIGLARAWALGMALAMAGFVGAVGVGAGDSAAFLAICVASGLALGADLVAPAALLSGVIQAEGVQGRAEGRWFGWWSLVTKLTLALAAGLALPLVQALGYTPGARDPAALQALSIVYALVPCAIKAFALALLWRWRDRWHDRPIRAAMPAPGTPITRNDLTPQG